MNGTTLLDHNIVPSSGVNETGLARNPQQALRTLGLPPHTPLELVAQALALVRLLVGQGIKLQQEALKSSPLFAWLEEHAGTRLDARSLAIALRNVTAG